jgi:ADP-ribose pyrophosphatase
MSAVTVRERHLLRKGRVFDIFLEKVTFTSGFTLEMEIVRHPGAAAIVALDSAGEVMMLRQYRHAVGDTIWEIPAGTLEADEEPLACARRELIEESGFSAQNWNYLGAITPVPGYADEKIHLYMATGLTACPSNLDPDEIVQVQPLPLSEVVDKILKGEIQDAKTIAAIFHVINRLNR